MESIPTKVKHSGVAMEFGESQLIVPPLTVGQVEELSPVLVEHDNVKMTDYASIAQRLIFRVKIVQAALTRNYPGITEDDVKEFLTGYNSDAAMKAALGVDQTSKRVKDLGENKPAEA